MAIRYDSEFNREITRIVKNFNAKVNRLEKQERDLIPDRVKISELKEQYVDRKQLKRKLKQLKSFTKRGAEDIIQTEGGVLMTEWQYETGRADYSYARRKIKARIKKYPQKEKSPYLKDENYVNDKNRLDELQIDFSKLSNEQLRKISKTVEIELSSRLKEEIFKNNLLKRVRGTLISQGYDRDYVDSIISKFQSFTGEQLLQIYKNEQFLADVMDFGDTDGEKRKITVFQNRKGAKLEESEFDKILQKMVTSIQYYELEYKK